VSGGGPVGRLTSAAADQNISERLLYKEYLSLPLWSAAALVSRRSGQPPYDGVLA